MRNADDIFKEFFGGKDPFAGFFDDDDDFFGGGFGPSPFGGGTTFGGSAAPTSMSNLALETLSK